MQELLQRRPRRAGHGKRKTATPAAVLREAGTPYNPPMFALDQERDAPPAGTPPCRDPQGRVRPRMVAAVRVTRARCRGRVHGLPRSRPPGASRAPGCERGPFLSRGGVESHELRSPGRPRIPVGGQRAIAGAGFDGAVIGAELKLPRQRRPLPVAEAAAASGPALGSGHREEGGQGVVMRGLSRRPLPEAVGRPSRGWLPRLHRRGPGPPRRPRGRPGAASSCSATRSTWRPRSGCSGRRRSRRRGAARGAGLEAGLSRAALHRPRLSREEVLGESWSLRSRPG